MSDAMLEICSRPECWRLIASHCPPAIAPVAHPAHHEWMRAHTHCHAHQEMLLYLRGTGHYGLLGQVYPCAPGSLLVFDAFEEHDMGYPPWAPAGEHLWIALTRAHAFVYLVAVREGRITRLGSAAVLTGLTLDDALSARNEVRRLLLFSRIAALLAAVVADDDPVEETADALQRRVVASVQQHIRDTAGNGASLDSLARLSGYSKYHFLRIFKQHTGLSVHAYIDACRLRRVTELLHAGYSKKAIALELGYSCPAAFSRWLHKQMASGELRLDHD